MMGLTAGDLATIVSLVATAADPTAEADLDCRRRQLLSSLAQAIEATSWVCTFVRGDHSLPACDPLSTTGDGWASDDHLDAACHALTRCVREPARSAADLQALPSRGNATLLKSELVGRDGRQSNSAAADDPLGVSCADCLLSVREAGPSWYSLAGYFRHVGAVPFGERDRTIVHHVFHGVPWLHTTSPALRNESELALLSKRERQVLQLLLEGHARKEVASRLHLSTHTVADYLKVIHKKLGVTSRAELLAKFIPAK